MKAGYVRRMSARSRERQHKRKHLGMLAYRHGRKKRRKRGPGSSTGTSKLAAMAMRRCWTTRLRDVQVVLRRRELDYRQALIRRPRRRARQLLGTFVRRRCRSVRACRIRCARLDSATARMDSTTIRWMHAARPNWASS
uniref:(northern house mosquito) hypothetical protein n=1 Tax=Culex pipiens TaxID=7175 RepID=A0A8D8PIC3_CULPI